MSEFKKRLKIEYLELLEKKDNLESFVNSRKINEIDNLQRSLLIIQLDAMTTYSTILNLRIENLK